MNSADLFTETVVAQAPLATRMRPRSLLDVVGQAHLLGSGRAFTRLVERSELHSCVLWGPPGTGKTTLVQLMADAVDARVESLSAVLAGVKEIRAVVKQAEIDLLSGRRTICFVDEIHRFNKAQQDAFLPHIESGTLIFVGATTENPSFHLNNALLSRLRVYVLKRLGIDDLQVLLTRSLTDESRGLGELELVLSAELQQRICQAADGDARQCLNLLEMVADFAVVDGDGRAVVDESMIEGLLSTTWRAMDRGGDHFYDLISALHKSVRGSDPDASLYWLARMIDGGCDLAYIARRLVRIATEDIGNADPRALRIALDAWQAYDKLGSPEGDLGLAQAVVYLAVAAKSAAVYEAWGRAMQAVKDNGSCPVPMHLRNAPTKLMKSIGCGDDYRYAQHESGGYAAGESYFPQEMAEEHFYHPVERGLELKIKEKLAYLRQLDADASNKRRG